MFMRTAGDRLPGTLSTKKLALLSRLMTMLRVDNENYYLLEQLRALLCIELIIQ